MSQVQTGQDSTSSNVESENNYQSPRSIVFRENKWLDPVQLQLHLVMKGKLELKFCKFANVLKILQNRT